MDEADRRNRLIEEQYPEGKAESGFSYTFTILSTPDRMVALEVRLPTETLRLFFGTTDFHEFATTVGLVTRALD